MQFRYLLLASAIASAKLLPASDTQHSKVLKVALRLSKTSTNNLLHQKWTAESPLTQSSSRIHRRLVANHLEQLIDMDSCEPLEIGYLDGYYYCEVTVINDGGAETLDKRSHLPSVNRIMTKLRHSSDIEWFEEQQPLKRSKRLFRDWDDPYLPDQWYLGLQQKTADQSHDRYFNLQPVWQRGINGTGVTVALVDDGLDMRHPDLSDSYFAEGSYDFIIKAPLQPPQDLADNHGTRCAGQIVSKPNNSICSVGIAFGAKISALRAISNVSTDMSEALSVNYKWDLNQIYSLSWGPTDDGKTMDGPRALTQAALEQGTVHGRSGLGSIYVLASGNGGAKDYCTFDGYASSIYTITVGAVDFNGEFPPYGELCPSQLISAYSGGIFGLPRVATTDIANEKCMEPPCCTKDHSGTSAAAPFVSGLIALVLSDRPDLGWRDIQQLLIVSARNTDPQDPEWSKNGAGFLVSHKYGFGVVDATRLLDKARNFRRLPGQRSKEIIAVRPTDNFLIKSGSIITIPINVTHSIPEDGTENDINESDGVKILEHVQLYMDLTHPQRKYLTVTLISPAKTKSILVTTRWEDTSAKGIRRWTFMTVRHWGESAEGTWRVQIVDKRPLYYEYQEEGQLNDLKLILKGVACSPSEREYTSKSKVPKCRSSGKKEQALRYDSVIYVFGLISLVSVVCGSAWLAYMRFWKPRKLFERRNTLLPLSISPVGSRLNSPLLSPSVTSPIKLPNVLPPPPPRTQIQKSATAAAAAPAGENERPQQFPKKFTRNNSSLQESPNLGRTDDRMASPSMRRQQHAERSSIRINRAGDIDMGQLPSPQVDIPMLAISSNYLAGGARNGTSFSVPLVDGTDDEELISPKSPQAKADWQRAQGKPVSKPFIQRFWG